MNDEQVHTLAQMQAFLDGTVAVYFAVAVEERYGFIARTRPLLNSRMAAICPVSG